MHLTLSFLAAETNKELLLLCSIELHSVHCLWKERLPVCLPRQILSWHRVQRKRLSVGSAMCDIVDYVFSYDITEDIENIQLECSCVEAF